MARAAPEVDRFGGEAHAVEKIGGATGGNERGGGIGEHDIAMRPVLAIEQRTAKNFVDDFGVLLRRRRREWLRAARGAGRNLRAVTVVAAHGAIAQFGDVGFAG